MVCGGPLIPKTKIKILNYTVNLFSVKVLNEDTIFASLVSVWSSATRESSSRLQNEAVPSFHISKETLSIVQAPD